MAEGKRKRRKLKPISGRKVENLIYKQLIKYHGKKWFIFRFNENRFNKTPADIQVQTRRYDVLLEIKATNSAIEKRNIRKTQQDGLLSYHKLFSRNLGILVFYFAQPKVFVLLDIESFLKASLPWKIFLEDVSKVGHILKSWKGVNNYFKQVHSRKRKIPLRK